MNILARKLLPIAAAFAVGGIAALAAGQASDDTSRYPYDPACPWGRIANGKGMIVRCIGKPEADYLLSRTPAPAGSAAGPAPAMEGVSVQVGPVLVDEGKLPLAEKKLAAPRDRYLECVGKHGGLAAKTGEVRVRFLVRARGRAEGVSVTKRSNVSPDAARCIADVVDRRLVGTPDAPMVGATVIVKFSGR